ncbi:MAG: hypothetical protein KY447_05755 [Actinobacteria bacterium]|nr:hypothetical protein [Actinomycetota bacterium]
MPTIELGRAAWAYVLARLDTDPDRDDGLTTTEIAVITFLLVGAAIVVMGIIFTAAKNNANNIPDPLAPAPGP